MVDLSSKTGLGRAKVTRLCKTLSKKDWIRLVEVGNSLRPVPWIPHYYQEKQVEQLRAEYDMAPLKAEFLLRKLLLFLVDRDRHLYNVRPRYLVNPRTGQRLEFDVLIDIHAWEFNGDYHYSTSEDNSPQALRETQARDLMKDSLSRKAGITLITVTTRDLSIEGIRRSLPPGLPLHHVDLAGPYAKALDQLCSAYRRRSQKLKKRLDGSQAEAAGDTEATAAADRA